MHASTLPSVWHLLGTDIVRYADESGDFQDHKPGLLRRISILITPSLSCCVLVRMSHALHRRGLRRGARALTGLNALLHRVLVDPAAEIGPGLYIPHPTGVVFRGRAGRNLTLYTKCIVGPRPPLPFAPDTLDACPRLGDDVLVGAFAIVVGPISVGNGARLGPSVAVTQPVAPGTTLVATQFLARKVGRAAEPGRGRSAVSVADGALGSSAGVSIGAAKAAVLKSHLDAAAGQQVANDD